MGGSNANPELRFIFYRWHSTVSVIRPKADMGVHSLDILTINSSDEGFKVVSVILWTDCIGPSSHNTTAGYQEWGFKYLVNYLTI